MNILVLRNFERLLWYLAFENTISGLEKGRRASASQTLDGWMRKMKTNGKVQVPIAVLQAANHDFTAERISDKLVCDLYIHLLISRLMYFFLFQ